MAFFLGSDLVFIDSMQFMNSSLDKLVKNLSDEDFKYLIEECGTENQINRQHLLPIWIKITYMAEQ